MNLREALSAGEQIHREVSDIFGSSRDHPMRARPEQPVRETGTKQEGFLKDIASQIESTR
jgi:hypothetical protein